MNNPTPSTRVITTQELVKAGGGTPKKLQPVTFEGHQFNAPEPHLKDPLASKAAYSNEIDAMYESMSHSEQYAQGFNDVAVNLHRVMQMLDGGVVRSINPKPGGSPSERTVEIGYTPAGVMQYTTIPEDWMTVPGFQAMCRAQRNRDGSGYVEFAFRRYEHDAIKGVLTFLRGELDTHSIYRGQVIDCYYNYISVAGFDIESFVYNEDIADLLNTWCISTLRNGKANALAGLSAKVSACLAGPPGTGKTGMLAVCRKICFMLGGTVVVVTPGAGIEAYETGLNILRTYMTSGMPALITMEDIENLDARHRTRLLELFDGATSKTDHVLMLTTTNTPEILEPALLRPGRIDQLIPIGLPDVGAFEKLLKMHLGHMLSDELDYAGAFPAFEGYTSAWIVGSAEVVLRGAIARTGSHEGLVVTTEDLIVAANGYRPQFEMQRSSADREPELPTLDKALQSMVYSSMEDVVSDMAFQTEDGTNYDYIGEQMDSVVENRIDQAPIILEDSDGRTVEGRLHTN